MTRFVFFVVAILGLYGPAKADWQTLKWGMTVKDVLVADKNASLLPITEQNAHRPYVYGDALVVVSQIEPGTNIRAILFFDLDSLREIKFIAPNVADGKRLFDHFIARFGKPRQHTHLENEVCKVQHAEWDSSSNRGIRATLSECGTSHGAEAFIELSRPKD